MGWIMKAYGLAKEDQTSWVKFTFDFPSACTLVQALWVSSLTDVEWHIHEHLYKTL